MARAPLVIDIPKPLCSAWISVKKKKKKKRMSCLIPIPKLHICGIISARVCVHTRKKKKKKDKKSTLGTQKGHQKKGSIAKQTNKSFQDRVISHQKRARCCPFIHHSNSSSSSGNRTGTLSRRSNFLLSREYSFLKMTPDPIPPF